RIGTLKLGSLKPRQWRHLTEKEVMELKGEKVPTMGRRFDRSRTDRSGRNPKDQSASSDTVKRNPKDRPKRAPVERLHTAERKTNERPPTADRPKRAPSDRTRSNTKPRTPRR
ncbi:MAG: hypothetical protein Q7T89_05535, partial [Anaerolineales bacterium]|nr:hypothetical protein [Anaerolineales bacterium]